MALRMRALWSGQKIGNGVSTFITQSQGVAPTASEASSLLGEIRAFFADLGGVIPANVTISFDPEIELFEESTGQLLGVAVASVTPSTVVGTGAETSAAGVGGRVRWRTGGFVGNRRVIGTTFIVPMPAAAYDVDGTLAASTITALQTAGDGLDSGLDALTFPLGVWSRPDPSKARLGALHEVLTVQVPDKVSWLKTRRD